MCNGLGVNIKFSNSKCSIFSVCNPAITYSSEQRCSHIPTLAYAVIVYVFVDTRAAYTLHLAFFKEENISPPPCYLKHHLKTKSIILQDYLYPSMNSLAFLHLHRKKIVMGGLMTTLYIILGVMLRFRKTLL